MLHAESSFEIGMQDISISTGLSGYLHHYNANKSSWEKRFFLLTNNHLKYYKDQTKTKINGDIMLTIDTTVQRNAINDSDFSFSISSPSCNSESTTTQSEFKLKATGEENLNDWIEVCNFK